jgi:hypothetical protein
MPDTPRTVAELKSIFADAQAAASITPQDMRDLVESTADAIGPTWANVRHHGGTGDGSTDDTAAIQAADTAAAGGLLFFPAGVYKYTSEITQTCSWIGAGGQRAVGDTSSVLLAGAAVNGVKLNTDRHRIQNLVLDGNGVGLSGFRAGGFELGVMDNVLVHDMTAHGFTFVGGGLNNGIRMYGCSFSDNGGDGIHANTGSNEVNNMELYGVTAIRNGGDGLEYNGTSLRVFGGWYATNGGWGIDMQASLGGTLFSPLIEENTAGGVNDADAFRVLYWKDISNNQSAGLGSGSSSIQVQTRSDAPGGGGMLEILGRSARGISVFGGTARAAIQAAGPGTDEELKIYGKGAGGVLLDARGVAIGGAGTNYGRVEETASDVWSLGHATTVGGAQTKDISWGANKVGFYGTAPIVKQTGVAVTDAAIHAALVNLGLISA